MIMSHYFLEPNSRFGGNIKIELDLGKCWYIIICKKSDLGNLKLDVDKSDID